MDAWYEGLTYLMWKPLFGIGKGQFVELNILTAHNSFVLAFAELGLIGYFVWLSILVLTALSLWRIASSRAPSGDLVSQSSPEWEAHRKIADVLLYAFVGYAATAFFLSRSYVILLFMLVGMTAALQQTTLRRWPTYPAVTFRGNLRLLVAVEIASLAFFFVLVKVLLLFD